MNTKSIKSIEETIMFESTKNRIIRLYRDNFLPEFVAQLPISTVYNKYLHIPAFFLWVFCIVSIIAKKLEGYMQDYINLDWSLIAFSELFWLTYFLPFVISCLIPLKPFRNLVCCLLIFYVYMVITSLIPSIGQWFAQHKFGHLLDLGIFIFSILIGHFVLFKKLFFTKIDGKNYYVHTK